MALVAAIPARPSELENVSIEEIAKRYVVRFGERKPDWNAFADAAIDGDRRAQHRFDGNTSGKPDANFICRGSEVYTRSVMLLVWGEGKALAHAMRLKKLSWSCRARPIDCSEEEDGRRIVVGAGGPWDCVSCPAGRDPQWLSQ